MDLMTSRQEGRDCASPKHTVLPEHETPMEITAVFDGREYAAIKIRCCSVQR
jgi:hypothetical protein